MVTVKRSASRRRALLAAPLAFCLVAAVGACSTTDINTGAPPTFSPPNEASARPEEPRPTATTSVRNDLARLPLKRSIEAGPVTVRLLYRSRLPTEDWRANVSKPLFITVSAANKRNRSQKIYLTKVSVNVTAFDEDGPVDGPRLLTDATNIAPGFIVTSPQTYNQNFILPAIDETAVQLTIDVTYEMVLQVSKDKDGRNFSKQVATDTLVVPVAP